MPTSGEVDFIDGMHTICGSGDIATRHGMAIHIYMANASMVDKCFYNSDGDMLIVPQKGVLYIKSEFGKLTVAPNEIVVMPQGIKFQVELTEAARGYILEVFDNHFTLPSLGPIGANGLANPRHFLTPVAWYEDVDASTWRMVNKFCGSLNVSEIGHSPFDVVAWSGNYVPYKYDLTKFMVINTVSYDHAVSEHDHQDCCNSYIDVYLLPRTRQSSRC